MAHLSIDINCDMGEGFPNDEALMPYITSANIACGFHAGDAEMMRKTVRLALQHGVKIGAHPSFFDRQNFGRTELNLSEEVIYQQVQTQLQALQTICEQEGATLHHVKPHGALYNMAARYPHLAKVIVNCVDNFDKSLIIYGLYDSFLIEEARKMGVKFKQEAFIDRTYQPDGSLTPRNLPNALIHNLAEAQQQIKRFVETQQAKTVDDNLIHIEVDTICIHGDGENALAFAKMCYETLN